MRKGKTLYKVEFLKNTMFNVAGEIVNVVHETDHDIYYYDAMNRYCYLEKSEMGNIYKKIESNPIPKKKPIQKMGYLRTDEDGHWFLVPIDKVEAFDKKINELIDAFNEDKYDEIEDDFIYEFEQYRLSGGVGDLKVLMEGKHAV